MAALTEATQLKVLEELVRDKLPKFIQAYMKGLSSYTQDVFVDFYLEQLCMMDTPSDLLSPLGKYLEQKVGIPKDHVMLGMILESKQLTLTILKCPPRFSLSVLQICRKIYVESSRAFLKNKLNENVEKILKGYIFNRLNPPAHIRVAGTEDVPGLDWHDVEMEIRNWFEAHELPADALEVIMLKDSIYCSIRRSFCDALAEGEGCVVTKSWQ